MADTPSDPRYPPATEIDFDSIMTRLFAIKAHHYPQHTARDRADPFVQLMTLLAATGQFSHGRVNAALKQFSPKSITSRRALISAMEFVNRPLLPIQPSRGNVLCKLKSAPVIDTVLLPAGSRIAPSGVVDPLYTIDEDVSTDSSVDFFMMYWDDSAETLTSLATGVSKTVELNDAIVFALPALAFDGVTLIFNDLMPAGLEFIHEFFNEEFGTPDSVTVESTTIKFKLDAYLRDSNEDVPLPLGLRVSVTYKGTRLTDDVIVYDNGGAAEVETSFLGQTTPSESPADYEIFAEWRPIPDPLIEDGTAGFSADGSISYDIDTIFNVDREWVSSEQIGGYAIRARVIGVGSSSLPQTVDVQSVSNDEGDHYVVGAITQGERKTISLGSTDGTKFQHLPIPNEPIDEPVADPELVIEVGDDADWFVVADFSNSGSNSKHAIFREDVDDGYGIQFGDGGVGMLPESGQTVKLTFRTGSLNPGDIDAGTSIKPLAGLLLVDEFVLYRGTTGYAVKEASTKEDVVRFRNNILPQLSLRAESAISAPEIVACLTGGAPNRPTFKTSDGRKPFSRAMFTTTGAGDRQYRMVVVGLDEDGTVDSNDLDEAEEFLNGVDVALGVERVGGVGPCNTEAIVSSFSLRTFVPTVTVTIADFDGVRAVVDQKLRTLFTPLAEDDDGEYRWDFGGKLPVPLIFGELWDSLKDRLFIEITVTSMPDATVYEVGDSIQLGEFELPGLDDTYDPDVNIIIMEPE